MYLAIDIEKKHFSIEKGLFAIGCILFNNQGLILETFRVIIQNDEWDEDTKSFWNKHLDVLMALEKDAISFREAMNLFNNFLEKCKGYNQNITLISDHPSFDIGHLEAHYAKAFPGKARLMTHISPEKYSSTEDVDGQLEILKKFFPIDNIQSSIKKWTSKLLEQIPIEYKSPHNPLYDVCGIAAMKLVLLE